MQCQVSTKAEASRSEQYQMLRVTNRHAMFPAVGVGVYAVSQFEPDLNICGAGRPCRACRQDTPFDMPFVRRARPRL